MNRKRMSIDSLLSFSTNYIVEELQKANMTIIKTDSGEPQVWFKDEHGEKQYVIIHTVCANIPNSTDFNFDVSLMKSLYPSKGYYAKVGLFSGDAIMYDEEGEIIPLGERDDINNPKDIIFEDTEIYVICDGFHPVEYPRSIKEDKMKSQSPIVIIAHSVLDGTMGIEDVWEKYADEIRSTTEVNSYDETMSLSSLYYRQGVYLSNAGYIKDSLPYFNGALYYLEQGKSFVPEKQYEDFKEAILYQRVQVAYKSEDYTAAIKDLKILINK